ncbi:MULTISPECIES: M16 family metallopeptidase [unclassified Yoonia]|uniref:M16 family metallopeptidase n=1 Tax=unclassified Yoonia TaxID=2629118 RepID=UPI002AFEC6D7|nr:MULTISPECIES: insulinase family protein [unclassified Yoonia]
MFKFKEASLAFFTLVLCTSGIGLVFAHASNTPVFVSAIPSSTSISIEVVFRSTSAPPGVAHYTEHLAWLNAVGGSARAANRHTNAWTSSQAVGYWLSGGKEDLPDLLQTLVRVFDSIDLPPSFAAEERNIILREYHYRLSGNTDARAAEALDAFLYQGNGLAASIIGSPAQIMALDYDAARVFHAATHRPELSTIVVTGDVTERQVRRAMREAGWPDMQADRPQISPPPFNVVEVAETSFRYHEATAAPRLIWRRVVALPEPVQFDLLEAQTALLRDILDTDLTGGLVGPLRSDGAMARSFDVYVWPIDEGHIEIGFRAAPDRDITLSALQAALEATLADLAMTEIPEETYTRVLNRFEGFWPDWDDREETADWMAGYVRDRVTVMREPLSQRELKRLNGKLTLTTTNALLHQLAGQGRTASAFIGPEDSFE